MDRRRRIQRLSSIRRERPSWPGSVGPLVWDSWRPRIVRDNEWPAGTASWIRADPVWQDLMRQHGHAYIAKLLAERGAEKENQ